MKPRFAFLLPSLMFLAIGLHAQTKAPKWVPLPMEAPKEVLSSTALGPKSASDVLHISVGIPYRDEKGMQEFVDSVSNPKSPNYRQFLTPEQVGQRFGVSEQDLKKVSDYISSQGMKIRLVAKNRLSILADATVAQAQTAFNTTIQEYLPTGASRDANSIRFSYTTAPSVPASIRPFVTMIGGLENFMRPHHHSLLTPSQLRTLYAVAPIYNGGFTGKGRTVAISNWDGYLLSNVPLEYGNFGLPTPPGGVGSNITVIPIDGMNGNGATAQGEGDVDIQCVLAAAPLCNLLIYDDANDSDLLGVITQETDDNKADILTESYGWSAGGPTTYQQIHSLHLSMSAQGMTYLCASGDTGTTGIIGDPYPDMDPEVLVVGGTSVSADGSGNRLSEVVWNDGTNAGGGGWVADATPFNLLPSYQKGNGVPTNIPYRLVPDIALDADPATGYNIFYQGLLLPGVGGTSCASPTAAGSLADCEQAIIAGGGLAANSSGKQRFGRIQDLLYSYNGDPSVFYDVVAGSNGLLPNGATSNADSGWDTASGWGAPIFNGLVNRVLNIPVPASISVTPNSVVGGTTVTGTLTLSLAAPKGGFSITLSSDSSLASPPSSVTVPAGATSVSFQVATLGTTAIQTANVTATGSGTTVTCALTLNPSGITGVAITPTSLAGGDYATGTVTLNGPAPAGGIDVSLSSNNSAALVPQHVEIAAGLTSDQFSIATTGVSASTTATITASYGGISASATITISPYSFTGFSVAPTSVPGGTSSLGTVSLGGVAPANGLTINLASNNPAATIPATVTIPAGASSATVTITTNSVSASTLVTLTASNVGVSFTATLTVLPNTVSALSVSPPSVTGGVSSTGTVTLTGPAGTGGVTVKLASTSTSATVPATLFIPAGASTGTFSISTLAVSSSLAVTISASQGGNTATAALTLLPATISGLTVAPSSVGGGSSAVGTVTLAGQAGPGGTVVSLSSNSSSATVPSSVTVAAGATSTTFTITTSAVGSATNVTLTASQGGVQQTATLTVNPAALASVTIFPISVTGGSSAVGTVTLTGNAPSGGMVVSLASNSASVFVPASVTVQAGAISTTFSASTVGVSSTTVAKITATEGSSSASATLTVLTPLLAGMSVTPDSVFGGNASVLTVILARAAPSGGAVVSLASDNLSATVPISITIPAGSSQATCPVATLGVSTTQSVTLSASLLGTTASVTLQVQPATLLSVAVAPNPIVGGGTAVGTIALNGVAPAGGLTVSVSSTSSDSPVPPSVNIAAGSQSATFNIVTSVVSKPVTVTITAAQGGGSQSTQLVIQPAAVGGVTLSESSVVGGSNVTVTGTVSVDAPAGRSGDTVELKSSSPSVLVISSSARVASGKTSATFTVKHLQVASSETVTVTATLGGVSTSTTIVLIPFEITSLSLSPASVLGGSSVAGAVTLNAAPGSQIGSLPIKLSSTSKSIGYPASTTIAVGKTSGQFTVTTKAVGQSTSAQLVATHDNSSQSATLTIQPAGLSSVTVSPSTVKGSSKTTVTGTVTLSGPAPATGAVITLTSSDGAAASVPVSVTIPAGKTSATFKVTHAAVTNQVTVTLSASYAGVTKSINLVVTPQ
jgi:hypothetical protein